MAHTLNSANHAAVWSVALVGNPNCGKTALFNLLTGARQKVANYAGVTVERKVGTARLRNGQTVSIIDLPGAYSLTPATPDEQVTLEVIEGRRIGEAAPDAIVAVVDATNLRMNLRLVLELKRLGRPMMVALNMADVARSQGLAIDVARLAAELGCPVVETVAIRHDGHAQLLALMEHQLGGAQPAPAGTAATEASTSAELQAEVRRILALAAPNAALFQRFHHRLDAVVMHPVWGLVILAAVLFLIFQAVFSWANVPMDAIKSLMAGVGAFTTSHMPDGPLRSLLVDGVIAGVGSVLVFLPQILILFFFILLLEDSGYLPRAAFLLDNLMGKVGLSGRAFIPLLSSFACAIPGIMATRTIANWKDRLATIMIAPLMTCSARLPVYALLIGAFIPNHPVWGMGLQGLVLFGLYLFGIVSAVLVAWAVKLWGSSQATAQLMMELPDYHWPRAKDILIGLWQRAAIFLRNVGGIILALTVILWFLSTFPLAPAGFSGTAIEYSLAGRIGQALAVVFEPIGFNWQIAVALIPSLAAREVVVSALGTVYALSQTGDDVGTALAPLIGADWTLATGLSLLVWFVFAPQCLATLAVVRKEVGGWAMPAGMAAFLFSLAYGASWITYKLAS